MLNEIVIKDLDPSSEVMTATNGAEALDFLKETSSHSSANNFPDLIFLDINMPIMNGFEFLEELSQLASEENNIMPSIVLLTSSHSQRDIEESKKYNVFSYINKPLTEEKLTELLAQIQL